MNTSATLSNGAWLAACLPEWHRFKTATRSVEAAQRRRLQEILSNCSGSAQAEDWPLDRVSGWEEFTRIIPVTRYEDYAPWIDRIRQGESDVLARGRVRCLEPTSGSGGPRKLVPFNQPLRSEFSRAVAAWIAPLFTQRPGLMNGRGYWSITPQFRQTHEADSAVPVGFAADADYLGGVVSRLADRVMAVGPEAGRVNTMPTFWHATLLSLLRCNDLRLMSVWHPSFILLLLAYMRENWAVLLADLHEGWVSGPGGMQVPAMAGRARKLEALGPARSDRIWPHLRLVSCWGGSAAEPCLETIRSEFPRAFIQPKGLMATEAAITIPVGKLHPLAVRSHFYEFRDDDGGIHPAWRLVEGREYAVIVTTSGGFLRYDLGDRVRVNGFLGQAPSLEFIGRAGDMSDHFGEKLESSFVSRVVNDAVRACNVDAAFTLIALERENRPHYSLFMETDTPLPDKMATLVDRGLRENVHYDLCRRLGQLGPVETVSLGSGSFARYTERLTARGMRLGDIKPAVLSPLQDWREHLPVIERSSGQ